MKQVKVGMVNRVVFGYGGGAGVRGVKVGRLNGVVYV